MGLSHGHRHVKRDLLAGLVLVGVCAAPDARADQPRVAEPTARPVEAHATLEIAVGAPDPRVEQERALAHGVAPDSDDEQVADAPVAGRRPGYAGGLRGTFGRAFDADSSDGWFGRLELEGFGAKRFEGAGPAGGVLMGAEYWRSDDSAGGGMPATLWFGYRTPGLFSSLGLGVDVFLYDEVRGDGGFGLYAPFVTACLGVELGGFRLLGDVRAIHRWQWGAPDRGQLQVGLTMSQFLESPGRPPEEPSAGRRRRTN